MTAEEILGHPFISHLVSMDGPDIKRGDPIGLFEFEFEQYEINTDIIKEIILDEIILMNSTKAIKHLS